MEGQVAVLISCLQGWGLEQPLMSAVCENELFGYAPDLPTIGFWQSGGWRGGWWLWVIYFALFPPKLEKEMATHSSILAWRIPGTEEPGGLLSVGSHTESDVTEAT